MEDTGYQVTSRRGVPRSVRELAAMTLLLLSYIWLWQEAFRGDFVVVLLAFTALGLAAGGRRGESPRSIGFRLDNIGRAARITASWIVPLVVLILAVGLVFETWRPASPTRTALRIVSGVLWGTAQQYGLNAFYLRGFGELLGGRRAPIVAAALTFSLFHLPNPFLTPVTFATGLLSAWLYTRAPNLFVLGIAHCALSLAIYTALPHELTGGLRVGPGYLHWLGRQH